MHVLMYACVLIIALHYIHKALYNVVSEQIQCQKVPLQPGHKAENEEPLSRPGPSAYLWPVKAGNHS